MHTFAMILDNPGEQPHPTRYRDPAVLRSLGYSDLIIYPTTGLSGLLGPQTLSSPDLRRWVEGQYDSVQQSITDAHRAGLGAWVMYDAPTLAAELVGSAMTCLTPAPGMSRTLCPASDELLDMCGQSVEALFARIDGIDGLVLRLGDTDAPKMPYLVGNDVYQPHCSRCASLGRSERLVRFTQFFYDLVVGKLGRKLIVRAWNVRPGGMHDNPELCQRVASQLPGEGDDRLILSFKFTQTDFWRYQRWNPSSLVCGDRPIIYELQCQREFEGKGAVPNWQAPLWRDGMTELEGPGAVGLAQVAGKVNLAGLWAWVRGGGWRGPYINAANETWIDANVYAVPKLAADPKADPADLARQWIAERLGVTDAAAAAALLNVLHDSTQNALQMFYIGPYARSRPDPWNPAANFIQDDQIDAEAAWGVVQRLGDAALDEAANEKQAAEQRLSENLRTLQQVSPQLPPALQERLPLSLQYAATLAQTLRSLITGLVAYRRWTRKPDPALLQLAEKSMRICQSCWVHHTQRIATHGGPSAFSSDDLWDLTQRVIDHLHEGAGA